MTTRITILVDNQTPEPREGEDAQRARLSSEHGLSLWIEHQGQRVLMDTGQGPSLTKNAPTLGVDLAAADVVVLSHGHYDHSGGIAHVLAQAPDAQVYCHPDVTQNRYSVVEGEARSIGMPRKPRKALEQHAAVRWVIGPRQVSECLGITGPIPRLNDFEDTGGPFFLDAAGRRPDPLSDDMALCIRTGDGVVICLGCAHSGLVNTIDYVYRLYPGERIRAIIGGLHLINAGDTRVQRTAEALLQADVPLVVACHCTGTNMTQTLMNVLGDRLVPGACGITFEF